MLSYDAVALVAEQKIQTALREGAFDKLPGAGRPLELENLSHLPPEMRMAYTILKNSGFIETPQQAALPKEALAPHSEENAARGRLMKLDVLLRRIRRAQGLDADLPPILDSLYQDKLLERI